MLTGENLRLLRTVKQIKQDQMARRLEITQQRYSALEASKTISEHWELRILQILNVSKLEAEEILHRIYVFMEK